MTEQTRAATAAAQTEDVWDRLAALAFGVSGSVGGCSERVHALDCGCALLATESASGDGTNRTPDEYPDYTDTEGAETGSAD